MWGVWLSNTCVLGEWLSGPLVVSGDRASRIRHADCVDKKIPNGIVSVFSAAVAWWEPTPQFCQTFVKNPCELAFSLHGLVPFLLIKKQRQ